MGDDSKQLPRRQTAVKPILKYSSSTGQLGEYSSSGRSATGTFQRPVQLFKHVDMRYLHQQVGSCTNGTASVSALSATNDTINAHKKQTSTHSDGSFSAISSMQKSSGAPSSASLQPSAPSSGHNQQQYTIINNSATSGVVATAPSNRTKSPYARPLSAKEVEPPPDEISMEMLHSILQAASANTFQGHKKSQHSENSALSRPGTGPRSGVKMNSFLRPNSTSRERRRPNTRPDHRKDPRVAAQNHLERAFTKPNVTSDANSVGHSNEIRKGPAPVANGYSISSNIARFGHDADMLFTEGASIKPRPIVNDMADSIRKQSGHSRATIVAKGQPHIQLSTNPRPLPQPPSSARSQASRPSTTSNTAQVTKATTVTVTDEAKPVSDESKPVAYVVKPGTPNAHIVTTAKPAVPNSAASNGLTAATNSHTKMQENRSKTDFLNSGIGRVIASPAVQRQIFADQTFSNKDGYRRTIVTVSSSSSVTSDRSAKVPGDKGASGANNVASGNNSTTSRPPTPKSSIPKPGIAKDNAQSYEINWTGVTQDQKGRPAKQITPFSKGSVRPGRSLTSSHLSIKPPTGTQKDSTLKVRNLNYTPNRPYSEVSEPGTPPSSAGNSTRNSPLLERNNNTTNGGASTLFYRKLSKAEEIIHDLSQRPRPKTEGAASRATDIGEKLGDSQLISSSSKLAQSELESDDGEWEDEQDDNDDNQSERRVPGDGEDDSDNYADEDDVIDTLDDDYESGSDGDESEIQPSASRTGFRVKSATKRMLGLSIRDGRSRASASRSRPVSAVSSVGGDLQPALTPSFFPHVPPTINFVHEGEKVEQLPWEIRKLLKWKMSPITPNVVKNCISRSYFRATKKNHDWLGYWGKHMKAQGFKAIREYQKVNHLPGSFQIGRKDRLWRNLSRMQVHHGKREFNFFPQTFCLPFDLKQLKRVWEDGGNKQKWIIKPPASARGIGIRVISKWNQIPKRKPVIVQKYLSRPYLINDSKFDLRIYVYVTSVDPLRIYVYDNGLVRFASTKYSYAMKNLSNKFMHLTNYSINKKNNEYQSNTDETQCQGHKWGLKALWEYLKKRGVDTNKVWESIHDLIVKTIISSESCINSLVKINVRRRTCVHELFGFDVMLDENLKPWIIEVNISPSLHSNSQLDINIKGGMIKDLMNLAGFMIPHKNDVTIALGGVPEPGKFRVPKDICINDKLYPSQMSPDERGKHAYYSQRHTDESVQSTILETLTPDDLRILIESIDEDSRRGNFVRLFPSMKSHKYLKFFESSRYYNLLLDAWVHKFHRSEPSGIAMLEPMCTRRLHLENPTYDPKHQWAPPNANFLKEPRVVSAPGHQYRKNSAALPRLKKNKKLSGSASSLSYTESRPSSGSTSRTVVGSDGS